MLRLLVVGFAALAVAGPAASAPPAGGVLTGVTQISFGCPGPVHVGGPSCNPWHPLARARFSVAGRIVRSDAQGRFTVRLPVGTYVVKPLAQPELHTLGGTQMTVRIRAGQTTRILVRFTGFPQMA